MSRLRFRMTMSLDGYTCGPNQSPTQPMGEGGMRLHQWVFGLAAFRRMHGMDGGVDNESTPVIEDMFAGVGASIMGRNMFGGQPGPWDTAKPWTGWWGDNPPFHHPVFVLTHHAREPLVLEGGNRFHFVTGGIHEALRQAQEAAAGADVSLGGGAHTAREFLRAGLVDEMLISLSPVLLGAGERLFEGVGDELHGLKLVRTIAASDVTHLFYSR